VTAPRRGRPPLVTPEAILDAVGSKQGLDWTMAGIAAELGVSEPAIYYHFPSKQALLFALGARVVSELELPSSDLEWEPWLEEFAHRMLGLCRSRPFLQDLDMAMVIGAQPAGVRLLEHILGHLVGCGFTLDDAAVACASVVAVVQPHVAGPSAVGPADLATVRDVAVVANAPLVASYYADPEALDPDAAFRQMLAVALSGIRHELAPQPSSRRRRVRA
jgi:TetR/AcrR family tetracycline transcriptional repressor